MEIKPTTPDNRPMSARDFWDTRTEFTGYTHFDYIKFAEAYAAYVSSAKDVQLKELESHESKTHQELIAILGMNDSLSVVVKSMRIRAEAAEADYKSAIAVGNELRAQLKNAESQIAQMNRASEINDDEYQQLCNDFAFPKGCGCNRNGNSDWCSLAPFHEIKRLRERLAQLVDVASESKGVVHDAQCFETDNYRTEHSELCGRLRAAIQARQESAIILRVLNEETK